jgi:hypothetical protein
MAPTRLDASLPIRGWLDAERHGGSMPWSEYLSRNAIKMAWEMNFPGRTARERAAHYEQEAEKFRRMAAAEPVEHIREELIRVAEQYQRLADGLIRNRAPDRTHRLAPLTTKSESRSPHSVQRNSRAQSSFDHFLGPGQNRLRNGQPESLGGFQIDNHLDLH